MVCLHCNNVTPFVTATGLWVLYIAPLLRIVGALGAYMTDLVARNLLLRVILVLAALACLVGTAAAAPPTIVSISPNYSHLAGGDTITITGTNFVAGQTKVTVGSNQIAAEDVTVDSETTLSFQSPASSRGSSGVVVTTTDGESNPGILYYPDAPQANSISPAFGPVEGGTVVTVSGLDYLVGVTSVTIGGVNVPADSVSVTIYGSYTTATFTTPAGVAGSAEVRVTTPIGTSNAVPGGFTYAAAPTATSLSPSSGPATGGTEVTVTGSGFIVGETSVTIGGSAVPAGSVTVSSATSLTFTTPAHAAGNVEVTVTTPGGPTAAAPGGFTYHDTPTAASLSPTSGPSSGGTEVTVTGMGFVSGETTVTIGGTAIPVGNVTVHTEDSLSFTTPAHAAGNVSVTVTTPGGTSTEVPDGFTYVDAPVVTSISPNYGPEEGGTLVTITGSGFDSVDEVMFGSVPAADFNVVSDDVLTATSPAGAGEVAVTLQSPYGTSSTAPHATFHYGYLIPPDSVRAEKVQRELSVFVARVSERAITGAVSSGIALGFSGGKSVLDVSPSGAFLAYVPQGTVRAFDDVFADRPPASDWSMWLDVRGTGLLDGGEGRQVNLTGGVGYRAAPDLLVGVVAGYEVFDYHSVTFDGDLRGDGTSIGGYVAWRPDGITFDAMLVYSGLGYDVSAGTASGIFDAARWLVSSGVSVEFSLGDNFTLTPSVRISAIWETQEAWVDSLAAEHAERDWFSASALAGAMLIREFALSDDLTVQLRLGAFAGYRHEEGGHEGLDGRIEAGAGVATAGGAVFDISGEVGGLGTPAPYWSVRGGIGAGF